MAEPWWASAPLLCLLAPWPLPPTFRVQVACWQPRPWVGTVLFPSLDRGPGQMAVATSVCQVALLLAREGTPEPLRC